MASYIYPQPEDRVGRAGGDWAFALRAVAHFPRFCFEIRATSREGKKNNGCEDNDTWQLEPCQIKSDQRKKRKNFLSTEVSFVGGWRLAVGGWASWQAGNLAVWQFLADGFAPIQCNHIRTQDNPGRDNQRSKQHDISLPEAPRCLVPRDAGRLGPTRLGPEVVRVFVVGASETYAGCPFLFRSARLAVPLCVPAASLWARLLLPGRASLSLFSIASKPHLQL
ncbi:hypothetical protein BDBG_01051 [Blastomyces gilchristii SLH14081]|uniref:Uncharacterized protein n=1 Tax=Blastomyces gilchristii (strain SLH14081) TaxID=559298 RepID=A0A179UB30_BLAGS|nr:uncharacterized protein BDBG_01051 [Blastomyces gilchristii SLH14081]OAT04508.1 hypothetical protein BDBG_01051 [Blastomyces gilchristii SLH14081]